MYRCQRWCTLAILPSSWLVSAERPVIDPNEDERFSTARSTFTLEKEKSRSHSGATDDGRFHHEPVASQSRSAHRQHHASTLGYTDSETSSLGQSFVAVGDDNNSAPTVETLEKIEKDVEKDVKDIVNEEIDIVANTTDMDNATKDQAHDMSIFEMLTIPLSSIVLAGVFAYMYKEAVLDHIIDLDSESFLDQQDFDTSLGECAGKSHMAMHVLCCSSVRQAHTFHIAGVIGFWKLMVLYWILDLFYVCGGVLVRWILETVLRAKLRRALKLQPSMITDFMMVSSLCGCGFLMCNCCYIFSVGQQALEVDKRAGVEVECCCELRETKRTQVVGLPVQGMPSMLPVAATTSVAAPTAVAAEAPAEAPVAAPPVAAPPVAAPPVVASPVGPVAAPSAAPAAAPSASATPKPAAPEPAAPAPASAPAASAAAEPAITKDENEKDEEDDSGSDAGSDAGASDCSSGPDLFEADAKAEPPSSPFVRTIGVLGSWLTPHAKEVLQCGAQAAQRRPGQGACEDTDSEGSPREELEDLPRPKEWKPTRLKPKDDDDRNVQRSRRELLRSELSSRIPPDVSYLAHRLDEVACALGVHQALPSVGEPALWDLAAALFLRALLRIEVRRGVLMPNADAEAILNREVDSAARSCLGKQLTQEQRSSQLEVLDAQLALPERPPSGLLALCSD